MGMRYYISACRLQDGVGWELLLKSGADRVMLVPHLEIWGSGAPPPARSQPARGRVPATASDVRQVEAVGLTHDC
jgi:hypothetical protein